MELGAYTLGSNEAASTVLSLKANSRLIKDLCTSNDATIEFTSNTSAKVTVGEEEYDLTFCDVKPTDAYRPSEENHLEFFGQVMGRFQVTNSRSGVGIIEVAEDKAALRTGGDGGSKKREISMLDTNTMTGRTNVHSSSSALSPPAKRSKPELTGTTNKATTSSASKAQATSTAPVAKSDALLTTSMIVLNHVPVNVSANDVMNSLFSGLSITAMFVCTRETKAEQLYSADTGEISAQAVVDIYVEFASTSGAELALLRAGEQLQYRHVQVDASSSAKAAPARASMVPHLQAVDRELAFWVKFVGLKLSTTSGSSTGPSPLSTHSTIRKHMEVLSATLKLASGCNSGIAPKHASCNSLSSVDYCTLIDPMSLLKYWHLVVSQLMLQHGVREIYDRNRERKVRISKSTKYLFFHPAVDDIMFSTDFISTQQDNARDEPAAESTTSKSKGFIDDEGEGLYRAGEDDQLFQFQDFVSEAEESVRKCTKLWAALVLQCDTTITSTDKPTTKASSDASKAKEAPATAMQGISAVHGVEHSHRRMVLSKVLYKEAWSLCTTHCVFDD